MNASQSADQILIPTKLPEQAEPAETMEPEFGVGAGKVFRDYNPNQIRLLPQDLSEWVPAGSTSGQYVEGGYGPRRYPRYAPRAFLVLSRALTLVLWEWWQHRMWAIRFAQFAIARHNP